MLKTCKHCGGTEFYASRSCKTCHREKRALYVKNNPEKVKECKELSRKRHPETVRMASKRARLKNPSLAKSHVKASMAKNPQKHASKRKEWRDKNRDRIAITTSNWVKNNPEKRRSYAHKRRVTKGKLSPDIVLRLFVKQKGKCVCCGEPLGENYHIDHIIPIALGGENIDNNIQLLRSICNLQKGAKHPVAYMQSKGFLC